MSLSINPPAQFLRHVSEVLWAISKFGWADGHRSCQYNTAIGNKQRGSGFFVFDNVNENSRVFLDFLTLLCLFTFLHEHRSRRVFSLVPQSIKLHNWNINNLARKVKAATNNTKLSQGSIICCSRSHKFGTSSGPTPHWHQATSKHYFQEFQDTLTIGFRKL